jgi:maltooligosyltrehalose trehalohydrolase
MQQGAVDGAVLSERAFLLRYFSDHGDRLLLINLGADLTLTPAPEPLLAPECDCSWERLWSSELPEYGGDGSPPSERSQSWWLPARSALVLKSVRQMSSAPEQP